MAMKTTEELWSKTGSESMIGLLTALALRQALWNFSFWESSGILWNDIMVHGMVV